MYSCIDRWPSLWVMAFDAYTLVDYTGLKEMYDEDKDPAKVSELVQDCVVRTGL